MSGSEIVKKDPALSVLSSSEHTITLQAAPRPSSAADLTGKMYHVLGLVLVCSFGAIGVLVGVVAWVRSRVPGASSAVVNPVKSAGRQRRRASTDAGTGPTDLPPPPAV